MVESLHSEREPSSTVGPLVYFYALDIIYVLVSFRYTCTKIAVIWILKRFLWSSHYPIHGTLHDCIIYRHFILLFFIGKRYTIYDYLVVVYSHFIGQLLHI